MAMNKNKDAPNMQMAIRLGALLSPPNPSFMSLMYPMYMSMALAANAMKAIYIAIIKNIELIVVMF